MTGLDAVIHPAHRLQLCAMLAAGGSVELALVREHLGLSPSALSKQVSALVDAGYVLQERGALDSRRHWLSLTPAGRAAFAAHVAALREIVAAADRPLAPEARRA
ncbi:transcriptional regulator [Agrococcus sp. SL85]|uniref:MarR family winged helix-turn-helix transcriptional regulator n=1 Tax=Agrococcus sp. SL85 TaxID=2995141 RepID=UPI00226CF397|nr:transcriptional regulator [Agrococcus sp. SL85]WAC66217.1 transcriptional regulator [Agrococcus sp. SL85]